jgi:hypothetical protein
MIIRRFGPGHFPAAYRWNRSPMIRVGRLRYSTTFIPRRTSSAYG